MNPAPGIETDIAIVTPFETPTIVQVVTTSETYPDLRREVLAALDQVRALPSYDELQQEITTALDAAKAITVTDADTYEAAGKAAGQLGSLHDRAEAWWSPATSLAYKLHRWLTARRGVDTGPLDTERARVLQEAGTWYDEQERQRVQREAEAALEEKRRQDAIAAEQAALLEAQGFHEQAAAVIEEAVATPAPVVSLGSFAPTKSAGLSHGKDYELRVLNEKLIPRDYLKFDEAKALRVVKAMDGKIHIPGVQIVAKTATRGKRRAS